MIKFFIRSIIVFIGIVSASFFAVISDASLGAIVFFLCIWISVCSFGEIFWWIVFVAFFYSIMHYDVFGVYFVGIIGGAYIFDLLKEQIIRSRREGAFVYYILTNVIVFVVTAFTKIFYHGHVFIMAKDLISVLVFSIILFFAVRWMIGHLERYITLYTRGSDLKCHT